jgi:glycerophosphoryl diester phosphodiesterase
MSFDPGTVAALRDLIPSLPRGLVAMKREPASTGGHGANMSTGRFVLQALAARLDFLAYRVQDLTTPIPVTARNLLGLPLLTWTVRTPEEQARAASYADQMIFEGFRP